MQVEKRKDRIGGLDGIRAIAFLLVLCGHCGLKWIPNGFGVTVFFFLSGYLITTLMRLEWVSTASISVSRFYIRRAFRILPLLYCAMLLACGAAWVGVLHTDVQWKGIAAIQLFLTNYADLVPGLTIPLGLSPLWSLAVEEHFYLAFPWIYVAFSKSGMSWNRQASWLGVICLLVLVWRIVLMVHFNAFWNRVYTGTDTRLDSILFGSLMAIAANPVIDHFPRVTRRQCQIAASLALAVLLVSIGMRGEMFRQTARYTIQGLALAPIFFYIVRYPDAIVTCCLEWKVLVRLGELSYSLYLVHYTVMFSINRWITQGPVTTLIFTFTISCALAEVLRRVVEKPMSKVRNRMLEASYGKTLSKAVINTL